MNDPVGDAAVWVEDGHLRMHVPAGVSHDFWIPQRAPLLTQPAPDADLAVEAKFDSPVAARHQMQGLVAQGSDNRIVRFDTFSDGSSQRLFAATFVNGTPTARLNAVIPATTPIRLSLERTGDVWTASWSADGSNWNTATTFTFATTMSKIGLFVANASPNPSMTSFVDYFRVGGQAPELTVQGVEVAPGTDGASVTWTSNQPADSVVEFGLTPAYGQSVSDPTDVTSHALEITGLACATTYHYRVRSTDPDGAVASSPDGTFTTNGCAPA
nr:fibronectin type III domain-containing protein [Micromonospora sp. DSM 115978]